MAPRKRGRARKKPTVGNTRLDAALDAMRPYEFPAQLVRETIDQLLEVYGGNEGWPFIEEASYSVLLEAILEKQNSSAEEEKKEDLLQGNATEEGFAETSSNATPTATTAITEASSSNPVPGDALLQISYGLDSASQTNDVQDSASLGGEDSIMGAEIGGHGQYLRMESGNVQKPVDNAIQSCEKYLGAKYFLNTCVMPPVIENPPIRRRKPCHGWIGDDDDHDPDPDHDHDHDLIHLSPAPLPKELDMLLNHIENSKPVIHKDGPRKRKTRWDEKPEGT